MENDMITDKYLLLERPHPSAYVGGVQRLYIMPNGYGLSLVNSSMLHSYPFAWEAAVVAGLRTDGHFDDLVYTTELTNDVVTFQSDEEANEFIEHAWKVLQSTPSNKSSEDR